MARRPGRHRARTTVRTGQRIGRPSSLEQFLTARWALHTARPLGTVRRRNTRPEWPLHRAELLELDQDVVAAAGVPPVGGVPESVPASPGLPVRLSGRRRISAETPATRSRGGVCLQHDRVACKVTGRSRSPCDQHRPGEGRS
ncbi:DUF2071 domain-containing protein [Pseudonocardia phyllosphaerae]|uniref:DUF2071 domain-containing protein n=1 Tax=Pseudonocardia phyllosphaerae TaxID=3390502 RepID=UPI00397B99F3